MKLNHLLWAVPAVLALTACSDDSDYDFAASEAAVLQQAAENPAATANFDPATGDIPFPNNLLFNGSEDGTLNIPLGEVDPTDISNPLVSLNALDGFSTTEPFTLGFSNDIDPASLVLGETVHVFEVVADPATTAVTAITRSLTAADVLLTVSGGNTLAVVPLQPLAENTDYMVIVTNGVTNTTGVPSSPSTSWLLARGTTPLSGEAAALEPVRQLVNAMLTAAEPEGVVRGSVIQAWTAKTQSITATLQAIKDQTSAGNLQVAPSGLNTSQISAALPGIADIYVGTLQVPYYRTAAANANDANAITSFWQGPGGSNLSRFNPMPVATSTQTIPVLMTVPNAASGQTEPAEGWPVAIFVHGVTRDRTIMLGVADAMAQAGFAVVAIDQAMHGITDTSNPLRGAERTFDLDLVNNDTNAPGPDGQIDSSGT
ncbi:MAG: Ig-like domain-containing protein, partial [Gammaproteobacteria bacterium]|nr:Ig-like domain-containing protein [Gammaproteobacteria bacterium]